ncbi:MAG: glycosyltransferase family 2 protein [Bacteroidetes bacterium]|nr:glycosyltransferase family 2 protein [Bacteroidota bacterium]
MERPVLSVLLPNYNNAPFLRECLDSIFAQTFQDFTVYFVDDCSTDDSVEIARSYPQSRMIIIRKEKNSGIVDTLNLGLDQIHSNYFIRMDGDDISHISRFEKLVEFMESNPAVDICTSNIQTFGVEEEIISFSPDPLVNKANLIFSNTIGHASSIFRTDVLKKNGIRYQNDFWRMEDYQLFYRLKDFAQFSCLPQVLYYYRRGAYNLNEQIQDRKADAYRRFYKMIFDELGFIHNDADLLLHAELGGAIAPQSEPVKYQAHINHLLSCNLVTNVFPHAQLEKKLNEAFSKTCFVLVELNRLSFMQAFKMRKIKGLFRYYLSTTFRKKSN